MRRKWLTGGVLLCLFTLPIQSLGVAHSGGSASPGPGSSGPAPQASGPEKAGWAGVDLTASRSKSKLGDKDNFGYGLGTGPAPCAFYDLREPEDLGVFDYELNPGDEVNSWTHTFPVTGTPTKVKLITYEIFADPGPTATIDLDGVTLDFEQGLTAVCGAYPEGGVKNVFVLTGTSASVAADGVVNVTFNENGDDISLDRAKLIVTFS